MVPVCGYDPGRSSPVRTEGGGKNTLSYEEGKIFYYFLSRIRF